MFNCGYVYCMELVVGRWEIMSKDDFVLFCKSSYMLNIYLKP